ncbi:hypothetical protein [Nocardioides currus]|uniref:Uncharacterized protein n=1 Tax=Nocardioides currus TaxID=2133958 RepID=A0A2R7Z0T7_9ACTN|nr:hypothetical protein [Nocardioides currus]PUA82241.1 hypothetical protein C7S10_00290 [Nocardioides currus]
MTQHDDHDLALLVRDDPVHTGPADTARMIRVGTRLRRRRQVGIAAAVGLAAAAVVAPFVLLGGTDTAVDTDLAPAGQTSASTSEAAQDPSTDPTQVTPKSLRDLSGSAQVCGVAVCRVSRGTVGSVERGEVIGTRLEMGTFDGVPEVLYAARNKGFDTITGKPKDSVDVLSAGIVVDGQLRRTVWSFQPVEEAGVLGPVFLYGAQRTIAEDGTPQFAMFGLIEGEHQEVTATVDGQSRPVAGLSTTVYPGYTAFYDRGPWDESWGDRAEITYGVPGGPSCTPLECGMIG